MTFVLTSTVAAGTFKKLFNLLIKSKAWEMYKIKIKKGKLDIFLGRCFHSSVNGSI